MKPDLMSKINVEFIESDKGSGKIKKISRLHNLIVNGGLTRVRDLLGGASSDSLTHIAIGTDNTAATNTDTVLGTELLRAVATITYPSYNQVKYSYTFSVGSGESYTITEAGLFDGASISGSTMFARAVDSVTLDTTTDLTINITYTITRG